MGQAGGSIEPCPDLGAREDLLEVASNLRPEGWIALKQGSSPQTCEPAIFFFYIENVLFSG